MSIVRTVGVLRLLRDLGPMTVFELSSELPAPYDSLWHLIYTLRAEGMIEFAGYGPKPPGRSAPTLWGLAPQHTPKLAPYKRSAKKEAACSPLEA